MILEVFMSWKQEWKEMPEFIQEKKEAYAKIIFRFESEEDLQEFAKLIGQKLTQKTKSAWFPYKPHVGKYENIWIDEEEKT
jgi:hypothetical protein